MPYDILSKKCLVVDDDRSTRKIIRIYMEKHSYEVVEAEDGENALELCKENKFDCILLDWNMPNVDGIEFLQKITYENNNDRPIIVVVSARNTYNDIGKAVLDHGADGFIIKPFLQDDLNNKLRDFGVII